MSNAANRARRIQDNLERLVDGTPDITGCALVSDDGLIIGSVLKAEADEESLGGMASILLSLGSRVGMELDLGDLEQVLIRGKVANALMVQAGDGALLLVLMSRKAKLGLVFLDVREGLLSCPMMSARATASVRERAWSFRRMVRKWVRTVSGEIPQMSAMPLSVWPSAASRSSSCWRRVSGSTSSGARGSSSMVIVRYGPARRHSMCAGRPRT